MEHVEQEQEETGVIAELRETLRDRQVDEAARRTAEQERVERRQAQIRRVTAPILHVIEPVLEPFGIARANIQAAAHAARPRRELFVTALQHLGPLLVALGRAVMRALSLLGRLTYRLAGLTYRLAVRVWHACLRFVRRRLEARAGRRSASLAAGASPSARIDEVASAAPIISTSLIPARLEPAAGTGPAGTAVIAPRRVRRGSALRAAFKRPAALLRAVAPSRSARAEAARAADTEEGRSLRRLALAEQAFGPDHPDVAMASHMLAAQYQLQRRYEEAEAYYTQALTIRERALGADHPEVALTLEDLAALYCELHRPAVAEPLLARAMRIHEAALGSDHSSLGRKREEYAKLLASSTTATADGASAGAT